MAKLPQQNGVELTVYERDANPQADSAGNEIEMRNSGFSFQQLIYQ